MPGGGGHQDLGRPWDREEAPTSLGWDARGGEEPNRAVRGRVTEEALLTYGAPAALCFRHCREAGGNDCLQAARRCAEAAHQYARQVGFRAELLLLPPLSPVPTCCSAIQKGGPGSRVPEPL